MLKSIMGRTPFLFAFKRRSMAKMMTPFCSSSNNNQDKPSKKSQSDQSTSFLKPNMVKRDGVFIDEERIKAKMKEIKDRSKMKEDEKKMQQKKQFMKNYEINKDVSKVKKFRKDTNTENLMQFDDFSLDEKPTTLQITSFSSEYIEVDDYQYPPSVILTPNQIFLWEIKDISQVEPHHFKIIQMVNPTPTYVLIGCTNISDVNPKVREYLASLNISFDIVPVFEAISNFNTCAADEIKIMAFIVSSKENS